MDKRIPVMIRDKIAHAPDGYQYICGNSDFTIAFDFDEEWNEFDVKTARFTYDGMHQDAVFSGNECPVPIISDTYHIRVGVFAGNLRTTTAAYIPAKKSILCDAGRPAPPTDDVYTQIMEKVNESVTAAKEVKRMAEDGDFNGADGKSAYQYAKDGGYTGTEAEFAAKLAQEIPDAYTLPVASADTLGGVKVGSGLQMDGEALGVAPEGAWERIEFITVQEEGLKQIERNAFPDGTLYNLSAVKVMARFYYPLAASYGTRVDFKNQNKDLGQVVITISTASTSDNPSYCSTGLYQAKPVSGLYEFTGATGQQGGSMGVIMPPNGNFQSITTNNKIDSILYALWTNHTIPIGTTIEIWGVRANA